jgi:PPOX class probable F420-dependent enzyme
MRRNLTPDDLGYLLSQPKLSILATHRADGTIMLSPVWHEWIDGGFTVITSEGDLKLRHLRRDPRTTIVVAEDVPPYRGIEIRGEAIISPGDGIVTLQRIASIYLGEAGGRTYAEATDPSTHVIIRIVPGVLRAWDFADEYVGG